MFSCLRSDTTVYPLICSSFLPHRPETNLFIRDEATTPTIACYLLLCPSRRRMAKFSSSAPAGKSSFSPSTIYLVLTGANRGAKHHRPNDAPVPLSSESRQSQQLSTWTEAEGTEFCRALGVLTVFTRLLNGGLSSRQ